MAAGCIWENFVNKKYFSKKYIRKQRTGKKLLLLFLISAAAALTAYSLILPAITLELSQSGDDVKAQIEISQDENQSGPDETEEQQTCETQTQTENDSDVSEADTSEPETLADDYSKNKLPEDTAENINKECGDALEESAQNTGEDILKAREDENTDSFPGLHTCPEENGYEYLEADDVADLNFTIGEEERCDMLYSGDAVADVSFPFSAMKLMAAPAWNETDSDGNGLNTLKYAEKLEDGNYKITLEQWIEGQIENEPLDIVMVLDVSGSMKDTTTTTTYEPVYYYDLDKTKLYYVNLSGTLYTVSYCTYCGSWRYKLSSFDSASDEHYYYYYSGYSYYHYYSAVYPSAYSGESGYTQFYEKVTVSDTTNKLSNLKAAADRFIDIVASADTRHNIALVKFSTALISEDPFRVGDETYSYGSGGYVNYTQIVADMCPAADNSTELKSRVNNLRAAGTTRTDNAMYLAEHIIDTDTSENKKIVVLFTDGDPQHENSDNDVSWDELDIQVANSAISYSNILKTGGTEIFTITLMDNLNDSVPWSGDDSDTGKTNRFMHYISSNYPYAVSMDQGGDYSGVSYENRYYYVVSDPELLESVFSQIAIRAVQSASMSLGSNAVMKDVVTRYFDVNPSSIETYTRDYDGNEFSSIKVPVSVNVSTYEDGSETAISITGFSLEDNYISTEPRDDGNYGRLFGYSFNISAKDEFIGGNAVLTNGLSSGIYEYDSEVPVDGYPEPEVNVPILEIAADIEDVYSYIAGNVTASALDDACHAYYIGRSSGRLYELMFDENGNAILDWQDDYAGVTRKFSAPSGQSVDDTTFTSLLQDTSYTVSVSALPVYSPASRSGGNYNAPNKNPGEEAQEKYSEDDADIYVFTPVLTFKDSIVDFGCDVPGDEYFNGRNFEPLQTHFVHETQGDAADRQMANVKPSLTIEYAVDEDSVLNGRIYTVNDVPVNVAVAVGSEDISEMTGFEHHNCNTPDACVFNCSWEDNGSTSGSPAFLLHVTAQAELPYTGGRGTGIYTYFGLMLIAAACWEYIRTICKKKRMVKND